MPIGGRQLRARLFSTEEVYKAALTNELVRLGIQPSPAMEAANVVWKGWEKMGVTEGQKFYAVVVPSKGKWTASSCSQRISGGPLYQGTGSARVQMELAKQAFAVIPISDVFERVNRKVAPRRSPNGQGAGSGGQGHRIADRRARAPSATASASPLLALSSLSP